MNLMRCLTICSSALSPAVHFLQILPHTITYWQWQLQRFVIIQAVQAGHQEGLAVQQLLLMEESITFFQMPTAVIQVVAYHILFLIVLLPRLDHHLKIILTEVFYLH